MNEKQLFDLFAAKADGTIDQNQHDELESALKASPEARELWFLYQDMETGLATFSQSPPARTTPRWSPLVSAAAGIAIGFFFTSIAWAVVGTRGEPAEATRLEQLLFEESFESASISWKPGFPAGADEWGGERGEIVLDSTQPTPEHGAGIARIEPAEETSLSYLTRIIEVGDLPQAHASEMRQLEVFASFHTDERGLQERYTLRVATFAEAPGSIRSLWAGPAWPQMRDRALTLKKSGLSTDGEEVGWQTLSAVVEIPEETRCVVISLAAGRLDPDAAKVAHYFDDVQANVVIRPQPTRPKRRR